MIMEGECECMRYMWCGVWLRGVLYGFVLGNKGAAGEDSLPPRSLSLRLLVSAPALVA